MSEESDDPYEIEPLNESLSSCRKENPKSAGKKKLNHDLDFRKIIFETSVIFEIIYGSILYLFLAGMMGIVSSNSNYYSNDCKVQLFWAETTFVFYSIRSFFTLVVLNIYCLKKFQGNIQIVINWMMTLLRIMFIIISLVIYVQMINGYVKQENCGILRKWCFIYIIVDSVNIGFTLLFLCCCGSVYVINKKNRDNMI
jgi:hypothetical protein